ncbi:MAG: DUF5667 domain-containing protein, partial [Candidatus Nanoarchaeia archaeon]
TVPILVNQINESEVEAELNQDPGVTPDSPLWGIDVALDRLAFRLAAGPKKAELGLKIARERLVEMKRMQERNKTMECERAIEVHEEILKELNETIEQIKDNTTIYGIQIGMQNHIAALQRVAAKIAENSNTPPEVKARLENRIRAQIGKAVTVETKVIAKREEIQNRTQERIREQNRTGKNESIENKTQKQEQNQSGKNK